MTIGVMQIGRRASLWDGYSQRECEYFRESSFYFLLQLWRNSDIFYWWNLELGFRACCKAAQCSPNARGAKFLISYETSAHHPNSVVCAEKHFDVQSFFQRTTVCRKPSPHTVLRPKELDKLASKPYHVPGLTTHTSSYILAQLLVRSGP